MSKHREEGGGRGTYLPLALVGVLAAGGITWWAVSQGGDDGTNDAAAGTTTTQMSDDEAFASAMAAHDHSEETSAEPEPTGTDDVETDAAGTDEESAEPTGDADASEEPEASEQPTDEGVPEPLAACTDEVAAGQTAADAAAVSAEHWKVHYTAQLKIDSGEYTFEEAGKDWANKKYGPEDVKRFNSAEKAYDKVSGACADLDVDALDQDYADAGTDCVDRSTLLADVVRTGAVVNQDWSDHVDQMAVKSETPVDEYYAWWIAEVKEAPKLMKPYDQAVRAFQDAPACEVG